jgi:hypothetical protein
MKGVPLPLLPVAVLVVLAAAGGVLWWSSIAPLPETRIIDAAAAAYVADTGGALTDCAARPSALEGVRLVVICADGAWVAAFDARGRRLNLDAESLEEEPLT